MNVLTILAVCLGGLVIELGGIIVLGRSVTGRWEQRGGLPDDRSVLAGVRSWPSADQGKPVTSGALR